MVNSIVKKNTLSRQATTAVRYTLKKNTFTNIYVLGTYMVNQKSGFYKMCVLRRFCSKWIFPRYG